MLVDLKPYSGISTSLLWFILDEPASRITCRGATLISNPFPKTYSPHTATITEDNILSRIICRGVTLKSKQFPNTFGPNPTPPFLKTMPCLASDVVRP